MCYTRWFYVHIIAPSRVMAMPKIACVPRISYSLYKQAQKTVRAARAGRHLGSSDDSASGHGSAGVCAWLRIVDLLTEMLKGFSQERSEVACYSTHSKHIYNLPGLRGVRNGCQLRIYGFTDLPPSLPLFPSTPWTRINESNRCRFL